MRTISSTRTKRRSDVRLLHAVSLRIDDDLSQLLRVGMERLRLLLALWWNGSDRSPVAELPLASTHLAGEATASVLGKRSG